MQFGSEFGNSEKLFCKPQFILMPFQMLPLDNSLTKKSFCAQNAEAIH